MCAVCFPPPAKSREYDGPKPICQGNISSQENLLQVKLNKALTHILLQICVNCSSSAKLLTWKEHVNLTGAMWRGGWGRISPVTVISALTALKRKDSACCERGAELMELTATTYWGPLHPNLIKPTTTERSLLSVALRDNIGGQVISYK